MISGSKCRPLNSAGRLRRMNGQPYQTRSAGSQHFHATRTYQQQSEWKEKTHWHNCVVYGGNGTFKAKLVKGAHVVIEGELSYREYNRTIETESGTVNLPWPVTEIIVESIRVLDRKTTDHDACEGAA
jgi:single-stranded DNA-binding protein